MEVISLQRQRINNLENEYDALYDKYEEVMRLKFVKSEDTIRERLNKETDDIRAHTADASMKTVIQDYAKQISTLKTKLTEQGAQILLTKEDNPMPSYALQRNQHKTGAFKRAGASTKHLTPLRDSRSSSRTYTNTINNDMSYEGYKTGR